MRKLRGHQAIYEAYAEEMRRDPNVFVMGEDMGVMGGPYGQCMMDRDHILIDEFGKERVRVTPISEIAIVGAALGAAITGMRPVADIMYMDFISCAMDQIANQVAKCKYMFGGKAKVPLTVLTTFGGYTASAAQHSQSLESWLMHIPGLKIVMPSTQADVKGLMKTAIRDDNPVFFVMHKDLMASEGEVPEGEYLIPFGQARTVRTGTDVTVFATSYMVKLGEKAAEQLAAEGISVEIIDPRTLVPLDFEAIHKSVEKTGKLVVVQEAVNCCSVGSEIAARIADEAFDCLAAPVVRVGAKPCPLPYSGPLELAALPCVEDIVEAVKRVAAY